MCHESIMRHTYILFANQYQYESDPNPTKIKIKTNLNSPLLDGRKVDRLFAKTTVCNKHIMLHKYILTANEYQYECDSSFSRVYFTLSSFLYLKLALSLILSKQMYRVLSQIT